MNFNTIIGGYMKKNGNCPICFWKKLFGIQESVTEIFDPTPYTNGVALTPPMGWSSWNTFKSSNARS